MQPSNLPNPAQPLQLNLLPLDNKRLVNLCGQYNEHLQQIEQRLDVTIAQNSNQFQLEGAQQATKQAANILKNLFETTLSETITPQRIHLLLQSSTMNDQSQAPPPIAQENPSTTDKNNSGIIQTRRISVKGRGKNQQQYLKRIQSHDVSFGIGPAGTGKTYLAVACAVEALEKEQVRRLILARPAVEAGEKLGFLPGDLAQKIDPYLRPLYDALHEMLGFERVAKLMERNVIEVAPLAFMRGRTLNESFIILDEAQNTTPEQIKMFLTRMGFGSKAVITGDITQVDLPRNTESGLKKAIDILEQVKGISFTFFGTSDVVRHELVQRIVQAYQAHE